MKPIALIGYSGHAYVVMDCFESKAQKVLAYCETQAKTHNPYNLQYLGSEKDPATIEILHHYEYFIAIGDNHIRRKIYENLIKFLPLPTVAVHSQSVLSGSVLLKTGTMVSARAVVNAQSQIGYGVILNTACVVEHECNISDFCHIAPAAVLCGNVEIGENSFIGANSVIKQGIRIGKNVIVGAGSVITKNIPDNAKVVGLNQYL